MSYDKNLKELEEIVKKIESGELSIDQLTKNVKRATELVALCRNRLTQIEEEIAAS